MSELLFCPFCGGEAHTIEPARYGKSWGVRCECGAFLGFEQTEAEAIAAWNSRAERTCKVESCCAYTYEFTPEIYYEFEMQCGGSFDWSDEEPPNYCPNCGAKVVNDGQQLGEEDER